MMPDWFPDWSDRPCALVASGPSTTPEAVAQLRGRCRVMVINTTYQIAPWADALYAADGKWWRWHQGAKDFAGLKITQDRDIARHFKIKLIEVCTSGRDQHRIMTAQPGVIGHGQNGAFQGLNLLVQFGVTKIAMLGVDYMGERWHGAHPSGRKQQLPGTFERWRSILDAQAVVLQALGVDVVNLSEVSTLTAYPRMSLDDAFARWRVDRAA